MPCAASAAAIASMRASWTSGKRSLSGCVQGQDVANLSRLSDVLCLRSSRASATGTSDEAGSGKAFLAVQMAPQR